VTDRALSKIQAHAKVVAARRAERLAEAQVRIAEARARAEERELAGSSTNWVPLAIGLGVIALVSVTGVIVYLYTRRANDNANNGLAGALPMQLAAPAPSAPQIYLVNTGTTGPAPTAPLCATPSSTPMQELPISAATQPRPRYHDDPCSGTRR
jgi:hypothetical protein